MTTLPVNGGPADERARAEDGTRADERASGLEHASADEALVVRPARRLRGRPALPGDKSISHRALLLALLAAGESRILAAGDGEDVQATARAIQALGARVERVAALRNRVDYRVESPGVGALVEPSGILDCGNSGTTTRLLAGLLAGQPLFAVLDGDASLRGRPMGRVVEPLSRMGAVFAGRAGGTLLPMAITGRERLSPISYQTPIPSAQVKSAILLAGLAADGETWVTEALATRDHTERMLRARGVAVDEGAAPDGRHTVRVAGPVAVAAVEEAVPADPSAAAFWLVGAVIHPDAELVLEGVSTNPTRRAIIDILRRMGADIEERALPATGGADGEPLADLVVRSSELRAVDLDPASVASAIDEIPILALAAAAATGTTRIRGAGELRHKESDRIAGIVDGLTALGARIRVEGDDIEIHGGGPLVGAVTDSHDDHRLAMTFAIAGLIAEGETVVRRPGSAAISYPGFFRELEGVRA
jgi:3-phosphoshikimate 1-carboxyvinyltransferase